MQSRWMSLVESVANVLVGYIVAVTTQYLVFPLFGWRATLSENLMIGLIFTGLCGAPHKPVYVERLFMRSLLHHRVNFTDKSGADYST